MGIIKGLTFLFSLGDLMPGLLDCSDPSGLYVMDINPQCLFFTSFSLLFI